MFKIRKGREFIGCPDCTFAETYWIPLTIEEQDETLLSLMNADGWHPDYALGDM